MAIRIVGLENFAAFSIRDRTPGDFQMDLIGAVADDRRGGAEWRMSGTWTGEVPGIGHVAGRRFAIRGASVHHFEDGKVLRWTDYWNLATLQEQVTIL